VFKARKEIRMQDNASPLTPEERSRLEALLQPLRLNDPVPQHSQADAHGLVGIIDRFLASRESDDTKAGFIKNAMDPGRRFVSPEGPSGYIDQLQYIRQQLEDMAFESTPISVCPHKVRAGHCDDSAY